MNRGDPCYFCGLGKVIRFAEHWIFCPECAAIYTYMVIWNKNCEHITKGVPVVRSDCWFKSCREGKAYIVEAPNSQYCSICGKLCEADGW